MPFGTDRNNKGQEYYKLGGIGESKEMHKFKVSTLTVLTALFAGSAGADVKVDDHTIPGGDIQAISISPSTGNIVISTKDGYTVAKKNGTVDPPPPGQVVINSFSISPTETTLNGTVSINWSTTNAVSCTPSGGTAAWKATSISVPSGVRNLSMPIETSFVFTLTCDGDGSANTATRSATVDVISATPTACGSTPLAGSITAWTDFWQHSFPMPTYKNQFYTIPRFGYSALKFETGSIVDNGKITTIETTQTDGVRTGTISECPGDFTASVPNSCRYLWGLGGGINWSTNNKSGACQLKPNTTYYFNITFTDGSNKNVSSCSRSPCVTELQHTNF
jgi:hypothetical protein